MSFQRRRYQNWLRSYMDFTKHSESPDPFHFWTGVSVIAGALRRQVWIEEFQFQWTPNFYIIFVAPPGISTKSTSIGVGISLLREIEGVHFGPNSMTWQALTIALEESMTTFEHEGNFFPMSPLTISISELGTFLKPKETELIDFLVHMWDGQKHTYQHRTKTGEKPITTILNPWMNIIGCTTPAWLRSNFPSYMIEGGLTSRVIFVYGNKKRQLVAYPSEHINRKEYDEQRANLIADLQAISSLTGEYRLTNEATSWGRDWYETHWANVAIELRSDKFQGYLARKQTHMHKIAIVLAASQRNELIITKEDLELALRLLSTLEVDMHRIFETIGMTDNGRNNMEILAVLRATDEKAISYTALWTLLMNKMERKTFLSAVEGMISGGKLKQVSSPEGMMLVLLNDNELSGYVQSTVAF